MTNKQDIITLWASSWIPRDDVFLMIQSVMSISSKDIFLLDDIDEKYIPEIQEMFQKRKSWIPLEYILWEAEFYGYRFFVTSDTLIPRNDTEVLVEKAIEYIKSQNNNVSLVDIWTGTGCIPISILKEIWDKIDKSYAIDISPLALSIAEKNKHAHELSQSIELLGWDLFIPLQDIQFKDLVATANLPYILDDDFENIDDSVAEHEPHRALFGWKQTGFELYEKLIGQLQSISADSIILFIEIGFDQWQIVRDFCKTKDISFQIYKDNGWIERCVEIKIR